MPKAPPELPYGVRLKIAYDGTEFRGWQRQPKQRTVQATIEEALSEEGYPAV